MCSWRDLARLSPGQDGRKGRWFSLLFKMGERSGCGPRLFKPFRLTRLPSVRIQQYALSLGLFPESILLWACFPSSSSKIDVIVGTPSDVLVGCARPVPRGGLRSRHTICTLMSS